MSNVEWDIIPNCRSSISKGFTTDSRAGERDVCDADRRVLEGVLRLMRGERYAGEPV